MCKIANPKSIYITMHSLLLTFTTELNGGVKLGKITN